MFGTRNRSADDIDDGEKFADYEPKTDPLLERLEQMTGSPFSCSNRVGSLGLMQGVSFVALHFLLSMDENIEHGYRQKLFDFLPDIAATTEQNDEQRAEMAARIACSELSSAALSAVDQFPDMATRLLDPARSLDQLCCDVKDVLKHVEALLAGMPATLQALVEEDHPEGQRESENGQNSADDDEVDLISIFPETKQEIDRLRLIDAGRVLKSAASAAEAISHPRHCMMCALPAMRFTAMIVEARQFTDIAVHSMRRILDMQPPPGKGGHPVR